MQVLKGAVRAGLSQDVLVRALVRSLDQRSFSPGNYLLYTTICECETKNYCSTSTKKYLNYPLEVCVYYICECGIKNYLSHIYQNNIKNLKHVLFNFKIFKHFILNILAKYAFTTLWFGFFNQINVKINLVVLHHSKMNFVYPLKVRGYYMASD